MLPLKGTLQKPSTRGLSAGRFTLIDLVPPLGDRRLAAISTEVVGWSGVRARIGRDLQAGDEVVITSYRLAPDCVEVLEIQ